MNLDDALILVAALTPHQALLFEPLEQRGQGVGVEQGALANMRHWAGRVFPQDHQHDVLRVGQTQRLQQGLIEPRDQPRGGVQAKAQLKIEAQRILGQGIAGRR
jgi:hypothetical protein